MYVLLDVQLHVLNALTMVLCCVVIRSNCFVFLSSVCIQCESVCFGMREEEGSDEGHEKEGGGGD